MVYRILHLSDTHATASGIDMDGADAVGALEQLLRDCRHVRDLDLVVVSGDVADDGSRAGYAAVRERVGAYADERSVPHVYCPGNHDERVAFAAELGSGHLRGATDTGSLWQDGAPERAAVSLVGGLRVITLDSLVPGSTHGLVSDGQLAWLLDLLEEPAEDGSVLVLHHPPIHVDGHAEMARAVLRNIDALAGVLRGSDVRLVLCGHLHLQLSGVLAGIPVWVTPGVVSRNDLTARPGVLRGVVGAGATVVELGGAYGPLCHTLQARQPDAGTELYVIDEGTYADAVE